MVKSLVGCQRQKLQIRRKKYIYSNVLQISGVVFNFSGNESNIRLAMTGFRCCCLCAKNWHGDMFENMANLKIYRTLPQVRVVKMYLNSVLGEGSEVDKDHLETILSEDVSSLVVLFSLFLFLSFNIFFLKRDFKKVFWK